MATAEAAEAAKQLITADAPAKCDRRDEEAAAGDGIDARPTKRLRADEDAQ